MEIASEVRPGILILAPEGEITLGNAGEVNEFVTRKMGDSYRKLVFDLKNVTYLDSSAVGMIVAIHTGLQGPDGGAVRLCNLSSDVLEVFKASSLESFLNIDLTLEESLGALA